MNYSPLLTDYYQFTMAYGYWKLGLHEQESVYHLFFRRNPVQGDYVMASGLQNVIDLLNHFQFTDRDLAFLRDHYSDVFPSDFLAYLKTLRFTGDIDAVKEGTIVFANEPLLRIRAPLLVCQLLETPIINAINFSSAVSTMASRMRHLIEDKLFFEFGLRRAQGPDGGITASRAAFIGGADATSNVMAGKQYDIPLVGTMSHAWIMSFENELSAFREYAKLMPNNVVLLVDTYETILGIQNAIIVGQELKSRGKILKGVRLDSGDLILLAKKARNMLDEAGLYETKIFVSGDISEERIAAIVEQKAPIDGYGVGTALSTSYSQPALDMVYKLGAIKKENAWQYKLKCSDNRLKTSDPGILQVKRFFEGDQWIKDIIYDETQGLTEDITKNGYHLLVPIFREGKCVAATEKMTQIRERGLSEVKKLMRSKGLLYSVMRDTKLQALKNFLMDEVTHVKK